MLVRRVVPRSARVVVLAALVLVGAVACEPVPPNPPSPCAAVAVTAHRDLAYRTVPPGTDPALLSLDVYEPRLPAGCAPAPVTVWVHGGGWRGGDKGNDLFSKMVLMASEGRVLVSVNYRLSPAVTYPTHNEDVAAAVAWVAGAIASYGGDPTRITLFGHSAGAGIVASVGTDARYLEGVGLGLDDLVCVVANDTEAYDVARQAPGSALYRQAFGTDPEVWADASPLTHLAAVRDGAPLPAFLVITRGSAARTSLSMELGAALLGAGAPTRVLGANPLSHAEVNQVVGSPGDVVVTPELVRFLRANC